MFCITSKEINVKKFTSIYKTITEKKTENSFEKTGNTSLKHCEKFEDVKS